MCTTDYYNKFTMNISILMGGVLQSTKLQVLENNIKWILNWKGRAQMQYIIWAWSGLFNKWLGQTDLI